MYENYKLSFDPECHRYSLISPGVSDVELISVTTAFKIAGLVDDTYFTQYGRDRGIAVHQAILYLMADDLYYDGLDAALRPYIDATIDFLKWSKFKPILHLCEVPNFHPIYLYAGTPDLVGLMNGRIVVIEIKSGGLGFARLQVAAYCEFPTIKKFKNVERYSLEVRADGTFRLKQYFGIDDFNNFLVHLNRAQEIKAEEIKWGV